MEAVSSLNFSPPQFFPRTQLRNSPSTVSSVIILNEQAISSPASLPITLARSALIQDNDNRSFLSLKEENNTFQETLDRRRLVLGPTSQSNEDNDLLNTEQHVNGLNVQLQRWISLSYLMPSLHKKELSHLSTVDPVSYTREKNMDVETDNVVTLAREALSACKEAASITEEAYAFGAKLSDLSVSRCLTNNREKSERVVRSTRLLERQSRRRRPHLNVEIFETNHRRNKDSNRKKDEELDMNDPLRMFLSKSETRRLLSAVEEAELIMKIQELIRLQTVRSRLQAQFSREPSLAELAAAIGFSSQALQSLLHSGNSSREKLIQANLRLVVHIAKQYQGHGLNFQDLLQEGSMGLMKSVEKFKPQAGCRFATYAYWWIRQSIRKALFQHSRTVRLPENVYGLLSKVNEAKRLCIQRGNHRPTKEDIAACAGMTVERLERLMYTTRTPLSMQQPVWIDQGTTFQEITADTTIEIPELGVAKHLMRQHVRNLLSILNPRERKIIRLRFGMEDGNPKSLSEIGAGFELSKERVRQLESRALYKLKQCLGSQGLAAYTDMLI